MKLIESARYSPNAKQKLQDTKESLLSKKKADASRLKKKPQLTANENLILSNFKEKLIEQMMMDNNRKKKKPKQGREAFLETLFIDKSFQNS